MTAALKFLLINPTNQNNNGTGESENSSLSLCEEKFLVPTDMDGHRLDFAVSRAFGLSRGFAQKLIKEGMVRPEPERRIKPSIKVAAGDVLNVTIPPLETLDLEPEDVKFDVVYSDRDVIVVNKPAGLVVHPAPGHWHGTLVHGLLRRFPEIGALNGVQRPGIVHRLDATTSGLMVVARDGLAQEGLADDFRERRVLKEYIALCWGKPAHAEGSVKYPIARDPYNRMRMAAVADGREAWTDYRVLWNDGKYSLLLCRLHSGRTHQIRVHMAAVGCPLVGDRLYAPSRESPFGPERVFLHAWHLAFVHPRIRIMMDFKEPLPLELRDFLNSLPKTRRHR